ncbi:MAG: acyl-CoA carboxylase subunit beta [Deltaproteobacteria bacterium]|nr:MAG: acyl-CoA carboxylase subunit beta [Deltaproteobacteria bacterium]
MSVISSTVDRGSAAFADNRAAMLDRIARVRDIEARIRAHGDKARPRFERRGQLMPRQRVARLLDPGSPFLELSTLAGYRMHDDDGNKAVAGGGSITGIGFVSGTRCLVSANDSAIKGGSISPMGLRKSLRAQEIALRQRLPVVSLIESGGANLMYQAELFVEGGRVFANMARLSAAGVPQITVVHGSSTAGGAYLPGLSDYVIAVRDRAKIFLAGPPLVKAALGEDADEEELGGAAMHSRVTGTVEYLAEDDAHAISLARELLVALDWPDTDPPGGKARPPRLDPDELCGIVPVDGRTPYDVREVIGRIVDDSRFLDFKQQFGAETVCGHARIDGMAVGILANNGPIMPEGSVKAAQFIQLCEQAGLPLVFLMNTTGYMVGRHAEQGGAVKHGSKMIQAVTNATVPKLTVVIGGAYGAGYYGMCGRSYDPDFIFAWPNARLAVMGGEQAAMVMKIITRQSFARRGYPVNDEALDAMAAELQGRLDREADALYCTARLWDDGIIDPRDTRGVLAECLRACLAARRRTLHPNSFGVARG